MSVGAMTECMNDPLWCSLVVEVNHLLSNSRVFEKIVAAGASTKGVGGVGEHTTIGSLELSIGVDSRSLKL